MNVSSNLWTCFVKFYVQLLKVLEWSLEWCELQTVAMSAALSQHSFILTDATLTTSRGVNALHTVPSAILATDNEKRPTVERTKMDMSPACCHAYDRKFRRQILKSYTGGSILLNRWYTNQRLGSQWSVKVVLLIFLHLGQKTLPAKEILWLWAYW